VAKYCLDTNVLIDALRSAKERTALQRFLGWALPATYLSAVVLHELEAGAPTPAQSTGLSDWLILPFERRGRVFAPSVTAWRAAGRALTGRNAPPPGLLKDLLLGFSCREYGMTLITRDSDFRRVASIVRGLRVAAPYPRPPRAARGDIL
jgi:predicted nucleic acid-binding protein